MKQRQLDQRGGIEMLFGN